MSRKMCAILQYGVAASTSESVGTFEAWRDWIKEPKDFCFSHTLNK